MIMTMSVCDHTVASNSYYAILFLFLYYYFQWLSCRLFLYAEPVNMPVTISYAYSRSGGNMSV